LLAQIKKRGASMFDSQILDVAIGIVFIYLLVSAMCSAILEGIESRLKTRAAYLEYGIRELLNDRSAIGIAKSFFEHPQISSLYLGDYKASTTTAPTPFARGDGLPSYIPAQNFARALLDMAARGPVTTDLNSAANGPQVSLDAVRANIAALQNPKVQRVLLAAVDMAQNDIDAAQKFLEDWYNGAMDRISGWYKRSSYIVLFFLGLIFAIVLNIDTLSLANRLYHNAAAREVLAAEAQALVAKPGAAPPTYTEAKRQLDSASALIGWSSVLPFDADCVTTKDERQNTCEAWATTIERSLEGLLGWLLTALAVTCGAPFWFDVLNKIMVIRSTVKPREKSQDEGSEDRQDSNKTTTPPQPAPLPRGGSNNNRPSNGGPPQPAAPSDADQSVDCCQPITTNPTADEDLPAARGGVQP
jgi:hypothetical protein